MQVSNRNWIMVAAVCACLAHATVHADHGVESSTDAASPPSFVEQNGVRAIFFSAAEPVRVTANVVSDLRVVAAPGSPTRILLWNESDPAQQITPWHAICLNGRDPDKVEETSYILKLRYADADPLAGMPVVAAGLDADANNELFIVQFVTQPLDEFRQSITAIGGIVLNFIANHAYIVRMSPAVRDAVAALPFVRWIGPLHPAYRVEEAARAALEANPGAMPAIMYNVRVFEPSSNKQVVADRIAGMGGLIRSADAGKFQLEAMLDGRQLQQVLRWNEVMFVDEWSSYGLDMNNGRETGGANYVQTQAGYTGQGVRGEVFDVGFYTGHNAFATRPLIQHTNVSVSDHGTSCSGIIFGDGTGNSSGRGLLPAGQGIIADFDTVGVGQSRYTHESQLVQAPYLAVFQSSSVGSNLTTQYTSISADTDDFLFDFDVLHCQSQSNAGTQNSRPQAWAKNIVSVGGIRHNDTLARTDDCWACGSTRASIGPASDGRLKPDLCHYYDLVLCPTSGDPNAYTSIFSGTSSATPIVAGHFGLFFQMWSEGIFGNPVTNGATVFENRPHMSTAKAMMINTASQYSFTGTSHDLTRSHQGWGHPDLRYLYDIRQRMFIVNESRVLSNLGAVEYYIVVAAGQASLRATLTWADLPGTPNSSQHRINDLSLRVFHPNGTTTYWGNNGLTSATTSATGGARDIRDTVENVLLNSPTAGVWKVRVTADQLAQDGRVETPGVTDADFALVVSGGTFCRKGDINGDSQVTDADVNGFIELELDSSTASVMQRCRADMNGDNNVDGADMEGFVNCLLSGACAGI